MGPDIFSVEKSMLDDRGPDPSGGAEPMAMPQRDDPSTPRLRRTGKIEAIKRLDALLEYAVMHNDEAEAARLRAELRKLTEEI